MGSGFSAAVFALTHVEYRDPRAPLPICNPATHGIKGRTLTREDSAYRFERSRSPSPQKRSPRRSKSPTRQDSFSKRNAIRPEELDWTKMERAGRACVEKDSLGTSSIPSEASVGRGIGSSVASAELHQAIRSNLNLMARRKAGTLTYNDADVEVWHLDRATSVSQLPAAPSPGARRCERYGPLSEGSLNHPQPFRIFAQDRAYHAKAAREEQELSRGQPSGQFSRYERSSPTSERSEAFSPLPSEALHGSRSACLASSLISQLRISRAEKHSFKRKSESSW